MTLKRFLTLITALACVAVWVLPAFVVFADEPEIIKYVFGSDDVPLESSGSDYRIFSFSNGHSYQYGPLSWAIFNSSTNGPLSVTFDPSVGYSVWLKWINLNVYSNGVTPLEIWDVSSLVNSGYSRVQISYEPGVNSYCAIDPEAELVIRCFDSRFETIDFIYSEKMYGLLKGYRTTLGLFDLPEGTAYLEFYLSFNFYPDDSMSSGENIIAVIDGTSKNSLTFHFRNATYNSPDDSGDSSVTDPTSPSSGDSSSGNGSSSGSSSFDDSGIIDSVGSAADKVIDEIGGAIDDQTSEIGTMFDDVNQNLDDLYDIGDDIYSNIDITNDKLDTMTEEVKSLPEKIMDGIKGLFVPDEEDMQAYSDKWDELLHTRFGALYESVDLISSYGDAFTEVEATNTVQFPSVTIPLAGVDFSFGGWDVKVIPEGFDTLFDTLRWMITILATVAFVNALRNKFERLLGDA